MNAATVTAPPAQGGQANTVNNGQPTAPPVPFIRASMEHQEPFMDTTLTPSTAAVVVNGGPVDVPAYGFMAGVVLHIVASGGTGAAAVYKEDAPWSIIQDITLMDVNGAPIYITSGFSLYLVNKWGGYAFSPTPQNAPNYFTPTTAGNFNLMLRVPVQLGRREALGALPNSNSSSTYKLRTTMAPLASVYSTNPTGIPTVRWRAFLEAWAQPTPQGIGGAPNAMQPGAIGTTQFWTETQVAINSGLNRIRLPRIGNLIRNLAFIYRASSDGLRATGEGLWPTDFTLEWDAHQMFNMSSPLVQWYQWERYGQAQDNGLRFIDYCHDFTGHPGDSEYRDLWIPTTQSTRLEMVGNFTGNGTLTILTNDVAPVGNVYV